MTRKTELTRDDIMPMTEYAKIRKERRREIVAAKRDRRMEIGPVAVCHFESYDSMWQQVHEMLFIEKGGEEQIADELAALEEADIEVDIEDPPEEKKIDVDGEDEQSDE